MEWRFGIKKLCRWFSAGDDVRSGIEECNAKHKQYTKSTIWASWWKYKELRKQAKMHRMSSVTLLTLPAKHNWYFAVTSIASSKSKRPKSK